MKAITDNEDVSRVYHKQLTKEDKAALILQLEDEMRAYAKDLNFEMAAQIRDAIMELKASK